MNSQDAALTPEEREQLARESIQNAVHLHERGNYAGAIKEYNRAAELREQARKLRADGNA